MIDNEIDNLALLDWANKLVCGQNVLSPNHPLTPMHFSKLVVKFYN